MQVSVSRDAGTGVLTVAVSGDLDLSSEPAVMGAVDRALAGDGVSSIHVDVSAVEFLDSSGVSLLLRGRRAADKRGLAYRVTGAQGIARQVLELTGVWSHLCDPDDSRSPSL